ncbi:hypothetical protein R1sor_009683 [Riccia sorocarpa]|uniref:Uncharacterized protein n=1 Tax=Riccia sorocarpa TaxID=122646 RepID=A0ABD3HZE1_9MARC
MESKRKKKVKPHGDMVGNGRVSESVAAEGSLSEVESTVDLEPKMLKKRKRIPGTLELTEKNQEATETESKGENGDRIDGNLVCDSTVDASSFGSVPVKKKKSKKHRRGPEETIEDIHDKDLEADDLSKHTVLSRTQEFEVSGAGNYPEASPSKKEEGRKRRKNGEFKHESSSTFSNLGHKDQAVVQDRADELEISPSKKKKKRKDSRGETEVEYDNSNSDVQRVEEEAVNVGNQNGLKESVGKKARSPGEEGDSGKENEGPKDSNAIQSDKGSLPGKKVKKKVRFKEPETHWREEDVNEDPPKADEDDTKLSGPEDEGNSSDQEDEDITRDRGWVTDRDRKGFKYGHFTKEEDEKVKTAVYDYIKGKKWGEADGMEKLLRSRMNFERRGAWVEIAKCLPRPVKQIYARAHILFSDLKTGTWSEEEEEKLKELHALHGRDWKTIEKFMGRSGQLCKDKWRKLRLAPILQRGRWKEEELDRLCKYVRWSLKLKEQLGRQKSHRILRDDINWEPIADKLGRHSTSCAVTWYERLASSLVVEGSWANGDDRRLLRSLMESGASSEEAVDWDTLLDDRDGLTCERRWYQMKRLLSDQHAPFEDKLEHLIRRYAPDLIGIEEDYSLE